MQALLKIGAVAAMVACGPSAIGAASANEGLNCPTSHFALKQALKAAVIAKKTNDMWAVVVNRSGVVCAVAFSGNGLFDQWLLSRQIAAAKAFTSNGLSTTPPGLKTVVLDALVQPGVTPVGQGLYGLAFGNPVDPAKAYKGPQSNWGQSNDPMVGQIVGGTITFGGGSPIAKSGAIVGGVGVSGDSAANDQIVSDAVAIAL
jgi:uncharacterized protein GlcG (DUF336 family)